MVQTEKPQSSVPKVKILIVDDKPANLIVLEEVLGRQDYHIVKAASGRAALRFLLNDEFAVVLLDVQMPDMDGFETAKLMRGNARTCNLPVIFISAKALSLEDIDKGYAQNAVDYILKPFNPEILRTKVAVFVELHRKTEQLREKTKLLTQKIEEEKQAKEAFAQLSDRLKRSNTELEQFGYVISHDLQEPLRMVASFVQLLARRYNGKLDDQADEYIHFAVDGANRMRELIASILQYSRINTTSGISESVDCDDILNSVLPSARRSSISQGDASGWNPNRERVPSFSLPCGNFHQENPKSFWLYGEIMSNHTRRKPIQILLVEDNPGDIFLAREALRESIVNSIEDFLVYRG